MGLYKRKDSSYWWMKHTKNGKTHYESTKTTKKAEAEIIWIEFLNRKEKHSFRHRRKTWSDLVDFYHNDYHPNDQRFLDWTLKYWCDVKLIELTNEDLLSLQAFRNIRVSAATCNRNFSVVRALLKKAEQDLNWIEKAPYLRKLKEKKFTAMILTHDEEKRLLLRLPPHLKAIVGFALATGLRKTTIVGLTHEMHDTENNQLNIPASLNKNGEPSKIPINQEASRIIAAQPTKGIYPQIFKYQGRPINDPARSAWRKAKKERGLEKLRFHDLRHTWTSRLAAQGVNEAQIAYLGGWKSTRMVGHYTKIEGLNISEISGY